MNIVLLGSGNVATHLGRALKLGGHAILQVWSRNMANATELADQIAAQPVNDLSEVVKDADIYILSVSDDAIPEVAAALNVPDRLVVHTAGSVSIDVLSAVSTRVGVLYPLQTFSKGKVVDFRQLPIAIEAAHSEDLVLLRSFAERLSEKVIDLNSDQRKVLHVAAVFACNFSNHLFALSQKLLDQNGLDFELIRPLIRETSEKIAHNYPSAVQTGPAVRGDEGIMKAHLELLKDSPDLAAIYELLSQSIVNLTRNQSPPSK